MSEGIKQYGLLAWPAFVVLIMDQATKLAVMHYLRIHESVTVLNGFFDLVHIRNRGMAFGIMNRAHSSFGVCLFVAVGLGAIFMLLVWFSRLKTRDRMTTLGASMILGGAVGNILDRLRFQAVVDFLDFHIGPYHWPAFNIADSAITLGAVLVGISLFCNRSSHTTKFKED